MSLALISDKNDILFIVNFIHYYPMAVAIILTMAYIYHKLRRYVAFEIKQYNSVGQIRALKIMQRDTFILFLMIA